MNRSKKMTKRIGNFAFVLIAVHLFFSLAIDYALSSGVLKDPTLFITMERISYILQVIAVLVAVIHALAVFLDSGSDGFQVALGIFEAAYFGVSVIPALFVFEGLFMDPAIYQKILANRMLTFLLSLTVLLGVLILFLHIVYFFFFKEDEEEAPDEAVEEEELSDE